MSTDAKGRSGARMPVLGRPLSLLLACLCLYFVLHFSLFYFFICFALLRMRRKHGWWQVLLEFPLIVSVIWKGMDFLHFLLPDPCQKLWVSHPGLMLSPEPLCWPGQILGDDWPRYVPLYQLTLARAHFVQDDWSRGYHIDRMEKEKEETISRRR